MSNPSGIVSRTCGTEGGFSSAASASEAVMFVVIS